MLRYTAVSVPAGSVGLVASDAGLTHLMLRSCSAERTLIELRKQFPDASHESGLFPEFQDQLRDYYAGQAVEFDVPIDLSGLTRFQLAVLTECAKIPYGQKLTYGELARALGRPTAARAVGHALARNPIPLVVPCHRVVGCKGVLVGFSAEGGVATKQQLLDLESLAPAERY
jgi:methylated-DNA-[protein]-cysteine S-methyltransferase